MTLYYSDPNLEPRECSCPGTYFGSRYETGDSADRDRCKNCWCDFMEHTNGRCPGPNPDCPRCKGTGRLGEEGAEPDIEVEHYNGHTTAGWRWREHTQVQRFPGWHGPYPTKSAALAAAREATR